MSSSVDRFEQIEHFLKNYGFWNENASIKRKLLSLVCYFQFTIVFLVLVISAIPQAENWDELADRILYAPSMFTVLLKTTNFYIKSRSVLRLYRNLRNEFKDDDVAGFYNNAVKAANKLFYLHVFNFLLALPAIIVNPLITGKMTIQMWYPGELDSNSIAFYIYWIQEAMSSIYSASLSPTLNVFSYYVFILILEYFNLIIHNFEDLEKWSGVEKREHLVKCIKMHRNVKLYCFQAQEAFSIIFFFECCQSILVLSAAAINLALWVSLQ